MDSREAYSLREISEYAHRPIPKGGPTTVFFSLPSWALLALLLLVALGAIGIGVFAGRRAREAGKGGHEPLGVVQGTLLGLVGLLLAFGMSMAVGRYENRRQLVVDEANAIGTAYLRAQLIDEPYRSTSIALFADYGDAAIALADEVPDSPSFNAASARMDGIEHSLWQTAGEAVAHDPRGTGPKLYVEALNPMFDSHSSRVASLANRVPDTVIVLLVVGSAIALGVLAMYLAMLGRGLTTPLLAAAVVVLILFVTFDLDRPRRGLITVPDAPLVSVRDTIDQPPAFAPSR